MFRDRFSFRPLAVIAVAFIAILLIAPALLTAADRLTLRVNDARVRPGAAGAVVIRTYASRPIDQGQVCFRSPSLRAQSGAPQAFLTLKEVVVFSEAGDAIINVQQDFTTDPPTILVGFSSASASINESDGPLAVLYFDVASDAPVGARIEMEIDPDESSLVGADGQPIEIRPRSGEVRVIDPLDDFSFAAEGDRGDVGEMISIGAGTEESLRLSAGQVGLRIPAFLQDLPRRVMIDPRYGTAAVTVDDSDPANLLISFVSADASVGRVPGPFIRIDVDTSGAQPGMELISLDPATTFLLDANGMSLPLALDDGEVYLFGSSFFVGDFEVGDDFATWSKVIGEGQ
jgi:hypothetical protein